MIWRESEQRSQHREYPWTLGAMQIYGSYKYRRDFIEAVKCPGSLSRTRPLKVGPREACCVMSKMLCCPSNIDGGTCMQQKCGHCRS